MLTKIAPALQEKTKKAYTVDRLSDHLKDGVNAKAMAAYLNYVRKMVPSEPVVHIDDSDVIKPDGYHFEALETESRNLPKWQILSCGDSSSHVVDSTTTVGMTMRLRFYEFAYCFWNVSGRPAPSLVSAFGRASFPGGEAFVPGFWVPVLPKRCGKL